MLRRALRSAGPATRSMQSAVVTGGTIRSTSSLAGGTQLLQWRNYLTWKFTKVSVGGLAGSYLAYLSYNNSKEQVLLEANLAGAGATLLVNAAAVEDAVGDVIDSTLDELRAELQATHCVWTKELTDIEKVLDGVEETSAVFMTETARSTAVVRERKRAKHMDTVLGGLASKKGWYW